MDLEKLFSDDATEAAQAMEEVHFKPQHVLRIDCLMRCKRCQRSRIYTRYDVYGKEGTKPVVSTGTINRLLLTYIAEADEFTIEREIEDYPICNACVNEAFEDRYAKRKQKSPIETVPTKVHLQKDIRARLDLVLSPLNSSKIKYGVLSKLFNRLADEWLKKVDEKKLQQLTEEET